MNIVMKTSDGVRVDECRTYHPGQFLPPVGSTVSISQYENPLDTKVYRVLSYNFPIEECYQGYNKGFAEMFVQQI